MNSDNQQDPFRNESLRTLNVGDFFLLLLVSLHLVDLVFGLCSDIGRVVTTVVDHLLLGSQVHDVGTDFIHEIGRVRGKDLLVSHV